MFKDINDNNIFSEPKKTQRNFTYITFKDSYGNSCSLQESSNIEPHIWLGMDTVTPKLNLKTVDPNLTGWIDFPLPNNVVSYGRMHLSVEQVKELIPYLQYFVDNNTLPENKESK